MLNRAPLLVSSLLVLSACGGGGPTFDTNPLSANGFAEVGQGFGGDYDFTIEGATRTVSANGDLQLEKTGPIRIKGTSGVGPIEVTLGGTTYTLERAPNNDGPATFETDNVFISIGAALPGNDFVELTSVFSVIDGVLNDGLFARGFDTNPGTIAKTTGTAEFSGEMEAVLRNGFDDAFGTGTLTMSVDFDGKTIVGNGVLTDAQSSTAEFEFDPVSINFDQTEITENNFLGTVSVSSDLPGVLSEATYDGRFFGPNGDAVAGQFTGRIDVDDIDQDTIINGGFLATK